MPTVPAGSLVFTGRGESGSMRYVSPAGVSLSAPDADPIPGNGVLSFLVLPNGVMGVVGGNTPNFGTTGIGTFNANGTFRAEYTGSDSAGRAGARDGLGHFYAAKRLTTAGRPIGIYQYDEDAQLVASWSIAYGGGAASDSYQVKSMGVSSDGLKAYVAIDYSASGSFDPKREVREYSLSGAGSYVGLFADYSTTLSSWVGNHVLVLATGDVLIGGPDGTGNTIRRYNAAGALQAVSTMPGGVSASQLAYGVTAATFWATGFGIGQTVQVVEFRLSDGAAARQFTLDKTSFAYDGPLAVLTVATGTVYIPNDTPKSPQIQCDPQTTVSNGGKGAAGCNTGGVGWTRSYTGDPGTVPQHDDPDPGETMAGRPSSVFEPWVELVHTAYPSATVETFRFAMVPLADAATYEGGYKPDGLIALGDLEHAFGNEQGGFESTTVQLQFSDVRTRRFRQLLDTQDLEGDEVYVKIASDEGRAAGDPPKVLMRAIVQRAALGAGLQATLTAVDALTSDFGPLGPSEVYPRFTYGDLGAAAPDMTADTKSTPISALYGEKSDVGAKDPLTGVGNPKGVIPGVFLGMFTVDGTPRPDDTPGRTLAEVVAGLQASVDAGTTATDWPEIGVGDAGALEALGTVPDTYDRLAAVIGYADLEALLATGTTTAPEDQLWGIIAFGLGPWYQFLKVHGSDLGGEDPQNKHDRKVLDITALSGSQLMVPGYSPCPWTAFTLTNPETGRVFDLAAIGVRGPILQDHLDGVVNIAVSGLGLMGLNDLPLLRAHDCEQHWFENLVLARKTAGPWVDNVTAPMFADETYMLNSASFAARQSYTATRLGGHGLLASWYPEGQKPVTQHVADWMRWTETKTGVKGQGQIYKYGFDDTEDHATWPVIRHEAHVFNPLNTSFGDSRENVVKGVCDYDPDASKFRADPVTERGAAAITRYKGREKKAELIANEVLSDEDQLRWVLKQRLARLQYGLQGVDVELPQWWLDYDIGQGFRINSHEGTGLLGYVDAPMVALRRRFSLSTRLVTFSCEVVAQRLIAAVFEDGLDRIFLNRVSGSPEMAETDDPDLAPLEVL